MTETEWNGCTDPQTMLEWLCLSATASDRKLRMFAVACCRRVLLPSESIVLEAVEKEEWGLFCGALEVAERRAEEQTGKSELLQVRDFARSREEDAYYLWGAVADTLDAAIDPSSVAWRAWVAALHQSIFNEDGRYDGTENDPAFDAFLASEKTAQAVLLRDIIGPLPFREVHIDPRWLVWNDDTVRRLTAAIYEHRCLPEGGLDSSRLAVLADALEEAGCTEPGILGHCRQQEGLHVRGCWVADLLLGKS